jgi:hypothetical protein
MCADADIALQMSYYNSDDDMSMSLQGANLAFESFCTLEPHSLTYNNGGSSNQPEAEYSYSLALNGETMFSSAETDSGMFGWSGNVETGGDLGLNSLKVSTKSAVKDGSLNIAYGNNEFKVQEMVEAENSGYQQQSQLGPGTVVSAGSGSTLQPVAGLAENLLARSKIQAGTDTTKTEDDATEEEKTLESSNPKAGSSSLVSSDENSVDPKSGDTSSNDPKEVSSGDDPESDITGDIQAQGIKYSISVQADGTEKQGSVDAGVMGLTEAQWATQVNYVPEEYFFGVKMRGIGFAPIDKLGMTGVATGFPLQILPPGNVEISYKDKVIPDTPEPWEDYPSLAEKESQEFDSLYAGKSTPALWYYLNNVYKNEVPVDIYYIPNNALMPLERYQLSMAFKVDGK